MVRFLIPLGWLGVVVFLVAGYYGYGVQPGSDDVGGHLGTALLAAAPLLMVYLCLLIYVWGTRRLVSRSSASDPELGERYRKTTNRTLFACVLGGLPLVAVFASGVPTHVGYWEQPAAHFAVSLTALICQIGALALLGRTVPRGETLLSEVEASEEYNGGASGPLAD